MEKPHSYGSENYQSLRSDSESRSLLLGFVADTVRGLGGQGRRREQRRCTREVEEFHHVVGVGVAQGQGWYLKRIFNQTQDRRVVASGVRDEARLYPGRDNNHRNAESALIEVSG